MTGVAGTGKSFTIAKVVEYMKSRGKRVAVTAPTGVAALNINGETLHSMVGSGVPGLVRDFGRMWGRPGLDKWRSLDFLVIDEVGMWTPSTSTGPTRRRGRSGRSPTGPLGACSCSAVGTSPSCRPCRLVRNESASGGAPRTCVAIHTALWNRTVSCIVSYNHQPVITSV